MANEPIRTGAARTGVAGQSEAGERTPADDGLAPGMPVISVKLQLDLPGGARIGPGKIRLLELIDEAGSLSRAAEEMRVSYRRAWLFIQQVNQAFDAPAVATPEHGHGGAAARLTDFGRELIRRYREMETNAQAGSTEVLKWLASHSKQ